MSKREQNAENMRRDELKRLEEGLLPGEPDLTPAPTTRDLTIGVMRSGLAIYRCLRTSSALEGYHLHLRRCVDEAWAAGEGWLDAVMNLFDFRWNVLAGRRIGLYDDSIGHFEVYLRDMLATSSQPRHSRTIISGW